MSGKPTKLWGVIAGGVRGAAHVRLGLPNQDALAFSPRRKPGPPLIAALADGHGSTASFRSALGAQMAVSITLSRLRRMVRSSSGNLRDDPIPWPPSLAEEIVCGWQERSQAHLDAHPITQEEWQRLHEKGAPHQVSSVQDNPLLIYGTTLLALLLLEQGAFFLQLGDGDMLTVQDDGEVRRVFPPDGRHIANETDSLCLPQAWQAMRMISREVAQTALIMASTDGYANSFRDEAAFFKAGEDFLALQRQHGAAFIRRRLSAWLNQTSRGGSGDDISLVILYRQDGDGST